jgi:hypothetical protein
VKKWKAWIGKQRDECKLGLRKITDYDFSRLVLKRFTEQLQPAKIVIPFRETIADVVGSKVLRVRGDIDKIFSFVELYAMLNLKRLQKVKPDVYIATPQVVVEALKLIEKPLKRMLGRIDDRVAPLLEVLKELGVAKGSLVDKKVREQIAVKMGKAEKTVRDLLNFLEASGYCSSDQKKPKTYTLLYDVEEIENNLVGLSAISQMDDSLMEKMLKEAQEWLGSRLEIQLPREAGESVPPSKGETNTNAIGDNNAVSTSSKTDSRPEVNRADTTLSSLSPQPPISNPNLNDSKASLNENVSKNRLNGKLPIPRQVYVYRHVKPAEPCELCGQLAVEWEIKTPEGNVLRRCSQCFVKLQKMLANVEWRFEEAGFDGGG